MRIIIWRPATKIIIMLINRIVTILTMERAKGKRLAATQQKIRKAEKAIREEGNKPGEFIDDMPYLERFR